MTAPPARNPGLPFNIAKLLRLIAVIGLAVTALLLYRPRYSADSQVHLQGYELFAVAESLVEHHSFSDPFAPLPTGPSAHVGPLYPAYLALVFTVLGHGSASVAVLMWTASLLFTLQVALLPLLTRQLHLGFWPGALAAVGWIAAGIPPAVLSDATFASVLVMVASYLMGRCLAEEASGWLFCLWAVVWAALFLVQPVAVVVLASWLLLLHFRFRKSARQKLVLGLLPILLVTPWTARNFLVFHKLFFIRDNLGIELAASNRTCATALFDVNDADGCSASTHPNENLAEALKVRELGEIEYNRVREAEAIDWIKANPKAFAVLSVQRFEAFWFPPRSERPGNGVMLVPLVLHCFTLLSVPGLLIMWRNARFGCYAVGLWLLCFPLIYYLIQFMMRYRYPIVWATCVAGSYFIVEIVQGIAGKEAIPSSTASPT